MTSTDNTPSHAGTSRERSGPDLRRRVEWLILLRLLLTTLMLLATIVFQFRELREFLIDLLIPLYVLIGATFLLNLIYAVSLPLIGNLRTFSFFQVMVDVVYYTVLVYFTGGSASAFSFIYIFPIIASGIILFRRPALLTASASCVLFGLLVTFQLYGLLPDSHWPWATSSVRAPDYVWWVMVVNFTVFFVTALISSSLSEQLDRTRTSLQMKEADYRKLTELHSNIVRSIAGGIITTDQEDRITFVNTAACRLLRRQLTDLVAIPLNKVFPLLCDEAAGSGQMSDKYLTTLEVEGERLYLEVSVSDLKDEQGVPNGRLVIFQDVTQFKKMEER
ncbi:MAG: PAS domain S-box protein, partial [Pseudomonadota bacterium]